MTGATNAVIDDDWEILDEAQRNDAIRLFIDSRSLHEALKHKGKKRDIEIAIAKAKQSGRQLRAPLNPRHLSGEEILKLVRAYGFKALPPRLRDDVFVTYFLTRWHRLLADFL